MTELFTRDGRAFTGPTTTNDKGKVGYRITRRTCHRCGGLGGSDAWKHTGWTCYECGGAGMVPCDRFERVYTAEELEKLIARAAKAEATRAAKAKAKADAEAARIAAEREMILAENADLLARIEAVTDVTGGGFLAEMFRTIFEKAKRLTEAQMAATLKTLTAFETEKTRKAAATYVGTVGEKVELELTYQRRFDVTEAFFGAPVRYIWTFLDADGNTIVYIGGSIKALDGLRTRDEDGSYSYAKGGKVKVSATVKAHKEFRGEPQTVIMRPKAI